MRLNPNTGRPEYLVSGGRPQFLDSNWTDIPSYSFLAVAEKLGRRWIGCDLSKFAIQVTRKRFLDIHNSKDLMEDDKE